VYKIVSVNNIIIPISVVDPTNQKAMKKIVAGMNQIETKARTAGNSTQKSNMKIVKSYNLAGKEIKRVITLTDKFGNSSRSVVKDTKNWESQMNSLRWKMVNFAFVLGAITQVASPFVKLTKEAVIFEHQLAKVTAVTGVAGDQIRDIVSATREGTPFTIQETTDAFLEFAKAGFTAEESTSALKNILDLSLISSQTLGQAASRTAQIIKQFGLEASDSEHITSLLSSTADTTRASVEGLGNALAYAGAIAGAAGQSLEDTVFSLGLLTDAGLDNQKSGTALRQIISALIDPSKKAQTAMNKLGISLSTASGEIKDTTQFMEELYDAVKDMTAAGQQAVLGEMFSVRALAGVEIFIKQIGDAGGSLDDFKDKTQATGTALLKSWQLSNTQLSEFKDVWNTFKADIIKDGPEMSNAINGFRDSLERLVPYVKTMIDFSVAVLSGFTRAAGVVVLFAAAVAGVAVWLGGGWMAAAIAGLVGLAGGGIIAEASFLNFSKTVEDWSESTKKNIESAGAVLHTHVEGYGFVSSAIKDTLGVVDMFNNKVAGTGDSLLYMAQNVDNLEQQLLALERQLGNVESGSKEELELSERIEEIANEFINAKQALVEYTHSTDVNNKSIYENITAINKLISGYNRFNSAVLNLKKDTETDEGIFDKLTGKASIHKTSSELKDFIDKYKVIYETIDNITGLYPEQQKYVNDIKDTIDKLLENNKAIEATEQNLYDLSIAKEVLSQAVKKLKRDLDEEKATLKDLQAQYKETERRIKELAKARFKDESSTITLLKKAELFQKKNELAALGVADAQQFITAAVKDSGTEYDKYFEKITKINGAMSENQRPFESWEQTIKSAIKAEVEAGQELEKDVTNRVKTWQTALLGISEFAEGGAGTGGPLEDFINKLQLASDVYFGGMRGDVDAFTRQKEDEEALLIPETSAQLIEAMQTEYIAREELSRKIVDQQQVVDNATNAYKNKVTELNDVLDLIVKSESDIVAFVQSMENATTAVDDFGNDLKGALDVLNMDINTRLLNTSTFGTGSQMSGDFFGGEPLSPTRSTPTPTIDMSLTPEMKIVINAIEQDGMNSGWANNLAPDIQDYLNSKGYNTSIVSE